MKNNLNSLLLSAALLLSALPSLAYTSYRTVTLPSTETGQTVTYALYNAAGTQVTAGVSGAVVELGGGVYGASITAPAGSYGLVWTETTGLLAKAGGVLTDPANTTGASSYTVYKTVSLPSTETGQTVTYAVYDGTGTQVTAGVSGSVVELGGGVYGASITVPSGTNYGIRWTETTGQLRTAAGVITQPAASTSTTITPTITGSTATTITMTWVADPGNTVTPSTTHGFYAIYRSTTPSTTTIGNTATEVGTVANNVPLTFTDTGLTAGTTYYYSVRSVR